MKMITRFVLVLLVAFLAACGGGGESVTVIDNGNDGGVKPPPGTTPPPPEENAVHKLQFSADNVTNLVALAAELATEGNQIIHLVRNNVETSLPIDNVAEFFWNGTNATWHSSPGGTGIGAAFTLPETIVPGLFSSDTGLPSIVSNLGEEYFLNIKNVEATGHGVTVVVDSDAGQIEYSRDGALPPPPPPPPPPVDYYTIKFVSPDVAEITFGDNSISFGLLSAVDPADVDYIQWRGNADLWSDKSIAKGVLSKDSSGVFHASIANMPRTDEGNFVIKKKNSDEIWFNTGLWNLINATIVGSEGHIGYTF